ncbi:uncharacterized protein LOC142318385 isoform X2 [Lycorma delicatula]
MSGNLLQFLKNQDHYIIWKFKACGGRSTIPCQTKKKNSGVLACGNQINQPCRKKLIIHKPKASDSGIYTCLLHKNNSSKYNLIISIYHVEFIGKERDPPRLLGSEPKNKSVSSSHSVELECRASSTLFPVSIKWLRRVDKSYLGLSNHSENIISYKNFLYYVISGSKATDQYYVKEAGPPANDVYLSKLFIKKAETHHAGHYACVAMNSVDISYREMYLTVLPFTIVQDDSRKPPQLIGGKPRNVSTVVQQTAVLECQVHSFLPPVVRWLRRVDHISFRTTNFMSPINYINNSYQLLNWNESEGSYYRYYVDDMGPLQNAVYISKLVFPVTTLFDTGFYACVVMNDLGIVHREVFLNVLPVSLTREDHTSRMSMIILILVPVILILLSLLIYCHKWKNYTDRHQQTNQQFARPKLYIEQYNNHLFHPVLSYKGKS